METNDSFLMIKMDTADYFWLDLWFQMTRGVEYGLCQNYEHEGVVKGIPNVTIAILRTDLSEEPFT